MSDALLGEEMKDQVDPTDDYEVVDEESGELEGSAESESATEAESEAESAQEVETDAEAADDDEWADADLHVEEDAEDESGEAQDPAAEEEDSEDTGSWDDVVEDGDEADGEPAAGEAAAEGEPAAEGEGDAQPTDEDEDAEADRRGPGPGAALSDEQIAERIYALLFASPDPLSVGKLVGLLERPPAARVRSALETIAQQLESGPLPYQLRGIKGGYTIMTVPEMGDVVGRLAKGAAVEKISPAALETLAIVAYRQPVTKAEIEAIRGVQAGPILRSLVDRALVKVTGRADVPGHPLQYGTTKDFLDRFGLMGLGDLPRDAELAKD